MEKKGSVLHACFHFAITWQERIFKMVSLLQ